MYYRQHIQQKLSNIEAKLKHIEFHNGRGNRQEVDLAKTSCEDLVGEIQSAIEREPMTPNEQNKQ